MAAVSNMMGGRVCPLTTRDLVDRCLRFSEALCGRELYTYQSLFCRRVVESILMNDAASITALWARQCGKSTAVANISCGMIVILPALAKEFPDDARLHAFALGFWIGIFAPIDEQAGFPYEEIRRVFESDEAEEILSDPEINVRVIVNRGNKLVLSNGSFINTKTASPDAKIEGRTLHLAICEESQDLQRQKVEKSIVPMLSNTNGTIVYIGTAGASRGGFHHYIQYNVEAHEKGGPRNHFEFPYDIVIAEKRRAYERTGNVSHLNYEKFVNALIEKVGIDNHEFKMNYRCLWMESRVIAIRPIIFASAAIPTLESGPRHTGLMTAGLDIGGVDDPTVLTLMGVDRMRPIVNRFAIPGADSDNQIRYRKVILDWLEMMGGFENETGQYQQLIEYLMMTSVKIIVIDATGKGDPVYERLEKMIGDEIVCVPYVFGSVSKSHLYKYYLDELNSGRIKYAAGPETKQRIEYGKFVDEHLNLDKTESNGHVVYQAPEGEHDDYPDSAALAAWGEKVYDELVMPEIEVLGDSVSAPNGDPSRGRGGRFLGQHVGDRGGEKGDLSGIFGGNRRARYTSRR